MASVLSAVEAQRACRLYYNQPGVILASAIKKKAMRARLRLHKKYGSLRWRCAEAGSTR